MSGGYWCQMVDQQRYCMHFHTYRKRGWIQRLAWPVDKQLNKLKGKSKK